LIKEWESDIEDENVFKPKEVKKIVKPSFEKIEFVNARNTTVKNESKAKNLGILTKFGQVPTNAVKQSFHRAVASVSAARRVDTAASRPNVNDALPITYSYFKAHSPGNPQYTLKDQGIFDSECSRHIPGNKSFLIDYQDIDGGFVAFGGSSKGVGPKVVVSTAEGKRENVVESSACWKPTGSEGFQEIVDFLNGSHIRAVDNREQQIIATIDGKEFTIIEASVRRHLQLADVDGEQTPLFSTMLAIQAVEGEGSGHPSEPQQPPYSAQPSQREQIPTIVSSFHQKTQAPRQALNKDTELPQTSVPIPHVPDEAVYEELVLKGNQDAKVTLVTPTQCCQDTARVHTYSRRRKVVNTGSGRVSTASRIIGTAEELVSTPGASMPVSTGGMIDKGKGIMEESEPVKTKTKQQQKQERIGLETAMRLQEQFDKEERQRIARVHVRKGKNTVKMIEQRCLLILSIRERNILLQKELRKEGKGPRIKLNKGLICDKEVPKLAEAGGSKRDAEEELDHGSFKKQKTSEASGSTQEQPDEEEKDLSQEDLQQMVMIVPVEEVYVEALHVKYPIIDWEVYSEDGR
nr:hypothetical protein [Tanacetum cinerariifolium]